jgi:hypothetical protein
MTSSYRIMFPDCLQSALDYRSSVSAADCPADVTSAMSKLPFFTSAAAPVAPSRFAGRFDSSDSRGGGGGGSGGGGGGGSGNRFSNITGSGSAWRPTHHHSGGGSRGDSRGDSSRDGEDDGFQTYSRRRIPGGSSGSSGSSSREGGGNRSSGKTGSWGGGGNGKYYGGGHNKSSAPAAPAAPVTPAVPATTAAMGGAGAGAVPVLPAPSPAVVAFSSAAVKANVATEERILAKVKGKINKIGPSTYDATKTFMQQILDSDETDFLDDFMNFVFEKAATESAFCPMYARLLHELADEFTHLRDVMRTLFRDYTSIFSEVDHTAPDPSSESYKEFVQAQERKKFRRGYSQFVAELVKHGEVDLEAFRTLLFQIADVIHAFHKDDGKKQLSEEYIDCLSNMCKSASPILIANSWSSDLMTRLAALVSSPAACLPGFSPKARFALMNLADYARRGWK